MVYFGTFNALLMVYFGTSSTCGDSIFWNI